jgi:hypothetical protein
MTPLSVLDARVARGAALLDERGPAAWRQQIDVGRLDVNLDCDCVIGQLYPNMMFTTALRRLSSGLFQWVAELHDWALDHGFDVDDNDDVEPLNTAWQTYLLAGTTSDEDSDRENR